MNRNDFHTLAARIERAYNAAQAFIANECPVLEQRLKTAALTTAINALTFALTVIDWASAQLEKTDEYRLIASLAYINSKRFAVRQLIAVARFNQCYQLTANTRKLWTRKGAIAQSALDKVFALN
ncbi:MAG: hypothetical protein DCF15_05865 [Phormidesmis priestleyi]|uniref:Uncharacterized protein n=1 Tax=Phormidesmis priestleyi TaxID=268141 RepID=A0A2W4ZHM1_9CYAN|nr:MAG: hypothetical protein DCF15_05865 [Phormidesmis priestleyi]